jgi:hypothetical protein
MIKERFLKKVDEELKKLKGFYRIKYLYEILFKLDTGIFDTDSVYGNKYRNALIEMLTKKDISEALLSLFFDDYKTSWLDEKRRYFDTNEEIGYKDFLQSFENHIPQDIVQSIKKCKSVSIEKLKLKDSIEIFKQYHDIREAIKSMISDELEKHKLTDNELLLLANHEKIKFEWLGSAVELVGLFDVLVENKWVLSSGSSRQKATCLLKCFNFSGSERTVGYLEKIYKTSTPKTGSFIQIKKR